MTIRRLSTGERKIFLAAVVVAVCVFVYSLAYQAVSRLRYLERQIAAKSMALSKDKEILAGYRLLEKETKGYSFAGAFANEEEEAAAMISAVQGLASKSSCYISGLKPRQVKKTGTYKELGLELSVEGTMSAISKFFYEVESQKEALRIKQFTILSSSSSDKLKSSLLITRMVGT